MTRLEFVADRLRRQWFHDRHMAACLAWYQIEPFERRRWVNLATAALDADSAWRAD